VSACCCAGAARGDAVVVMVAVVAVGWRSVCLSLSLVVWTPRNLPCLGIYLIH